jgi:hypothetical protein
VTQHISQIISFGRSLARLMSGIDLMAHLDRIDGRKVIGMAHVAVCRSHVPSVLNVEAWRDNLPPQLAATGLEVAAERLRIIHDVPRPLRFQAIDLYDAETMRKRAEQLVDMCRSSSIKHVGGGAMALHTFDQSRENCVRAAIVMLGTAALVPSSLNRGG